MLPDIDSTFFHVLCGNLIVSKGSLYVYLFELNLRNLLYVIKAEKSASTGASGATGAKRTVKAAHKKLPAKGPRPSAGSKIHFKL